MIVVRFAKHGTTVVASRRGLGCQGTCLDSRGLRPVNGARDLIKDRLMLVRFDCPACGGSHSFDMPETTIHMTCGQTRKTLELRLTRGGDVKSAIVEDDVAAGTNNG